MATGVLPGDREDVWWELTAARLHETAGGASSSRCGLSLLLSGVDREGRGSYQANCSVSIIRTWRAPSLACMGGREAGATVVRALAGSGYCFGVACAATAEGRILQLRVWSCAERYTVVCVAIVYV